MNRSVSVAAKNKIVRATLVAGAASGLGRAMLHQRLGYMKEELANCVLNCQPENWEEYMTNLSLGDYWMRADSDNVQALTNVTPDLLRTNVTQVQQWIFKLDGNPVEDWKEDAMQLVVPEEDRKTLFPSPVDFSNSYIQFTVKTKEDEDVTLTFLPAVKWRMEQSSDETPICPHPNLLPDGTDWTTRCPSDGTSPSDHCSCSMEDKTQTNKFLGCQAMCEELHPLKVEDQFVKAMYGAANAIGIFDTIDSLKSPLLAGLYIVVLLVVWWVVRKILLYLPFKKWRKTKTVVACMVAFLSLLPLMKAYNGEVEVEVEVEDEEVD